MFLPAGRKPALESAATALFVPTVGGSFTLQGTLVLSLEEGLSYSGINVCPGQRLVQGGLAPSVKIGFKTTLFEGVAPVLVVKVFTPAIKGGAQFPGTMDDLAQPAVAP